jgi:hypothetical protein
LFLGDGFFAAVRPLVFGNFGQAVVSCFAAASCWCAGRAQWMREAVSLGRTGMAQAGGGPFGAAVVCDEEVVGRAN